MTPGDKVRYYRNGWRCGVLVETKHKFHRIRPIGPKPKHCVRVPIEDVREVEEEKGKVSRG